MASRRAGHVKFLQSEERYFIGRLRKMHDMTEKSLTSIACSLFPHATASVQRI